jgi:hypothetical protein
MWPGVIRPASQQKQTKITYENYLNCSNFAAVPVKLLPLPLIKFPS